MITAMTRMTMMTIIANMSPRTVITVKMSCKTDGDGDLSNFFRHGMILVPDVKLKNIGSMTHLVLRSGGELLEAQIKGASTHLDPELLVPHRVEVVVDHRGLRNPRVPKSHVHKRVGHVLRKGL